QAVDHSEGHRVHAQADGEGADRDDSEGGAPPELSERQPRVLQECDHFETLSSIRTRTRASPNAISSPDRRRTPRDPAGTAIVRPPRTIPVPCSLRSSCSRWSPEGSTAICAWRRETVWFTAADPSTNTTWLV